MTASRIPWNVVDLDDVDATGLAPGRALVVGSDGQTSAFVAVPSQTAFDLLAADAGRIEELLSGAATPFIVDGAFALPVFVAPFACTIAAASLWSQSAAAASDTNYWTVTLKRWRANVSADIAAKTTQVTGGAAIAAKTDWNYDSSAFSASNKVLQKGDAVEFAFAATGSPSSIDKPFCEIRYEPS
jgi:hypothetical protein